MTIECDICCEKQAVIKYKMPAWLTNTVPYWEHYCSDCDLEYAYENRHFEQDDIVKKWWEAE